MNNQPINPQIFTPRMPDVDFPPKLEELFDKARNAAGEDTMPTKDKNRGVAIATPGRMFTLHPCPVPGTLDPKLVESVEKETTG